MFVKNWVYRKFVCIFGENFYWKGYRLLYLMLYLKMKVVIGLYLSCMIVKFFLMNEEWG